MKEIIEEEIDSDDASTHIIPTLMAYTDGKLKFNKLHRDLERLIEFGGTISKKQVQFILNDDELNCILECTLMQRTSFNASFQGEWKGPRSIISIHDNSNLEELFKKLLSQVLESSHYIIRSIYNTKGNEIKLFADTRWGKIEAGDGFEIDSDELIYRMIFDCPHFSRKNVGIKTFADTRRETIEAYDGSENYSSEFIQHIKIEDSSFSNVLISIDLELDDENKHIMCTVKVYDKSNPINEFVEDSFKLRRKT